MKLNNEILANREFISLAKVAGVKYDERLSQNYKAVTPNGLNWLFLRPNTATSGIVAGVNPSYTGNVFTLYFPFMVWLILQNKPVGEYVKRYLCKPRVRPHRPFLGLLTQNYKGASIMTANAILSHSLAVLTAEYEHYNAMHANNPYMGYADRANAIYNAIQALKQHASQSDSTNTQPKHQNALQRIWGALVSFGGAR